MKHFSAGNIVTYEINRDTEKIRYIDVCSLYSYVLKIGAFQVGNLEIYIGEKCGELISSASNYNFYLVEGSFAAEYSYREISFTRYSRIALMENYYSRYVETAVKRSRR